MSGPNDTVTLISPEGKATDVPAAQAAIWQEQGFTAENPEARAQRVAGEAERANASPVTAVIGGVGRGLTVGLSDVAAHALGGDQAARELSTARQAYPTTSTLSEVGGAIAPALMTGGESLAASLAEATPIGRVAQLGSRIGALGEDAGVVGRIGAKIAGGAVEGGIMGAGQGVSELALDDQPITWERAVSAISSNALLGSAIGGAGGALGGTLEYGLGKAKTAIDDAITKRAAMADVGADVVSMDAPALTKARQAELESLSTQQTARGANVADDVKAYRATVKEANPWLVVDEGENAAKLNKTNNSLGKMLDDPRGLAENPRPILKQLRIQEDALSGAMNDAPAITSKFAATNAKLAEGLEDELSTLPGTATDVEMSGKLARRYAAYNDVKLTKGAPLTVAKDDATAFLDDLKAGKVHGEGQAALGKLQGVLDQNRALQKQIESNLVPKAELTSPRLQAIDAAKEALSNKKESIFDGITSGHHISGAAGGAIGGMLGGPIGAIAGAKTAGYVAKAVMGRLSKATVEQLQGTSSVIKAISSGAAKTSKVATPLATSILSKVRFGPEVAKAAGGASTPLAAAFKARSAELRQLTAYDETGTPRMRPDARAALADKLSPIRAVAPVAADRLETAAVRRVETYAAALPRKADIDTPLGGPDKSHPSDFDMRGFARVVAVGENPLEFETRILSGKITPEECEAYRNIYPERAAFLTREVMSSIPTMSKALPYKCRLALSMVANAPIEPSMHPLVLGVLQGAFKSDPGTQGGTMAPKPMPQFGSVKKSVGEPTPAQRRSQGGIGS